MAAGAPYFVEEGGADWHPVGQNDAISWVELDPLFRRRDVAAVEVHVRKVDVYPDCGSVGIRVLRTRRGR